MALFSVGKRISVCINIVQMD